jgi:hypothetical protein
MRISKQATRGHLVVGAILVGLALAAAVAGLWWRHPATGFLIFFFGVWGGVELGRYLEHTLTKSG